MSTPSAQPPSSPTAAIAPHNHPFPFLLYLEWGLLAIAIGSEILPAPLFQGQVLRGITILSIIGFGLLGLRLPTRPRAAKLGFTLLEILLVGLASITGPRTLRLFPLLHLVLVIRSCLMFSWQGRLGVTAIAFLLFTLTLTQRIQAIGARLPNFAQERIRPFAAGIALIAIVLFALMLAFVVLLINALLAERQSQNQLAIANEQLRHYALRIEDLAMAQERNRIARDIHDALGHSLTALNLQLEAALKLWQTNPEQAQTLLKQAKQLGSTALSEVRQSVGALRATPLQEQSLEEAIVHLIHNFQTVTGVQPQFHFHLSSPLAAEVCTALYRIVQEALTNTCKYATATQVALEIKPMAEGVQLTYWDNGQGFDPQQHRTGFGLQGMRERTLALGGNFQLTTAPGQGCQIQALFPTQAIHPEASCS